MKPKIVFFARDYQATFFPMLKSDQYESIYVTYNQKEKKKLEKNGVKCDACFEELFNTLELVPINDDYLITSFTSDRYMGEIPLKERNEYLRKSVGFWSFIFDKYKPNFVLNEVIAIEFSEVMYIEAKRRNIEYLAWMVSPFADKQFYWLDNPFNASLKKMIFQYEPDLASFKFAEDYLLKLKDSRPFYVNNLRNRFSLIKLFSLVKKIIMGKIINIITSPQRRLFYFDHSKYLLNQLKSYFASFLIRYDKLNNYDNFEFVFYPLHYEPEASLTYFAEFYDDQLNTIRNISKCIKNNQYLIVKEHPQQPGILLTKKFRELKHSISNLLFLPAEQHTIELIDKINLTITVSSTAGWESLLAKKPVFVLGKVFYDKHPDINLFTGFENLKMQIRSKNYKSPSDKNNLKFLSQFYSYCNLGSPYPNPKLYDNKNIEFIRKSIENKIR